MHSVILSEAKDLFKNCVIRKNDTTINRSTGEMVDIIWKQSLGISMRQ